MDYVLVRPLLDDQGHAGGLGAGIEFETHGLSLTLGSVNQPDGEWKPAVDPGTVGAQEFPGPGRVAGHERLSVLGQDEDEAYAPSSRIAAG
jgi:hypothetical protein